ncbi:MAG: hypothetical protein K5907_02780 [Treponema sp.]|nr:hypothetical protein [Treponema sp.]
MSDSTENTNELDSYGVWVKNNNQESNADDSLNFAESLDLPDFEESGDVDEVNFDDMFKEDDTLNIDPSADDTTLTDDELLNITNGDGIEIAEAPVEESDDNESLNDISDTIPEESEISDDFNFDEITEDSVEAPSIEEETSVSDEEVSTEDFGIESSESSDGGEDEEISLDDFMDEGFSDESVASGNNGFAADAVPSASDSEEVSLDDFVDMSEFGVSEEAPKKEEAIVDEKPLDMDISFDSSADTIQTEENIVNEADFEDDYEEEETAVEETAVEETVEVSGGGSDNIDAEEVDLSDFGIDADAEETPVTQDVEGAKSKEAVVDYDLSVENDNASAAPVVNEIKSPSVNAVADTLEEIPEEVEMTQADSGLLQQIVEDLSNLKAEINNLKTNLEEIKAAPHAVADSIIEEEIAIEEDNSDSADTGFFSGDDGDDTIALSTDELSNILNTADFNTEEPVEPEDTVEEEVPVEETQVEETFVEEEAPAEEPVIEETFVEEEVPVEETPAEETVESDTIEHITDAVDNFEVPEEKADDLSYDFTDENLSEPNIDEIEIDEDALEDDLPEEISIPKEDNILVESSSSDFMDSVQDTTDEHEEEAANESAFSTVDNIFEETTEEPAVTQEPAFEDVDVVPETEPEAEDETFVSEEEVNAPETIGEPDLENDFVSHEDDNNNLTDSNIDYLTTEDKDESLDSDDENAELKKDIKSVLLYMDQLLENLPEEKIVEFAKSDEFTTYKKLFSELGLS